MTGRPPNLGVLLSIGFIIVGGLVVVTILESKSGRRPSPDAVAPLRNSNTVPGYSLVAPHSEVITNLPVISQVADFTFTNQLGNEFCSCDLNNEVWVANVIFTRCPSVCPIISQKVADLQKLIPTNQPVRFLTFTTDPDHDTPAVLKRFADRFGANPDRWLFLTGPSAEIRKAVVDSLKLIAVENEPGKRESANDLFTHSMALMLVDRQGRVRASIQTDEPDYKERALKVISFLLKDETP
jgi:protein SCO1/2